MKEKRRRIWIDHFQTLLFLRITVYFALYGIAIWSVFAVERGASEALGHMLGPSTLTHTFLAAGLVVLVLGVLFVRDALLLTHRLVGPIYRLRKMIQAVKAGQEVERMSLREGDFLHDLKDEFNEMLEVLERRGAVTIKPRAPAAEADRPVSV